MEWSDWKSEIVEELSRNDILSDDAVYEHIQHKILKENQRASLNEKNQLIETLYNHIRRLGALQPYLDDDSINEVMVNGPGNIFVEKGGKMLSVNTTLEDVELIEIIQRIVNRMNRRVNEKEPICDVRLPDGSRVNIILPPIALDGPYITIRKFVRSFMTVDQLVTNATISQEALELIENLVKRRYNVFISGGTSSGKTTLLNALSESIGDEERVITIEDSAELKLQGLSNLIRLETRHGVDNYMEPITIRDLIRASLRMRPDRIIVGEVRGEETIDMLQAMNTGHDGSLSTGHANSIREMLLRLETMVLSTIELPLLAIRQQIASAVDVMIHLQKIHGKGRRVMEIAEIDGVKDGVIQMNTLYTYNLEKDQLMPTGKGLKHRIKWEVNG